MNKLENLDKNAEIYEYYINDKWDLDGIKDDLKILNERKKQSINLKTTLKLRCIWCVSISPENPIGCTKRRMR